MSRRIARRPRPWLRFVVLGVVVAAGAAVALVLTSGDRGEKPPAEDGDGNVLVRNAGVPGAMAPRADGGLVYAERATGRIFEVAAGGARKEIAKLDVADAGVRGLAVGRDGTVFASWVEPSGDLVLGSVEPLRVVWRGPKVTGSAISGGIAIAPDEKILMGVGDLGQPDLARGQSAPNGKILELDPAGAETQKPNPFSSGWRDFSFAVTARNELWVADDAEGKTPDRLAQVSGGDRFTLATRFPGGTDPSGVASPAGDELVVCARGTGKLLLYRIQETGVAAPEGTLANDCRLGVIALSDGRLAYATLSQIKRVAK